jgi:hypothetical protein
MNHNTTYPNRHIPTEELADLLCGLFDFLDTPLNSLPYTLGLRSMTLAVRHRYSRLNLNTLLPFEQVTEKQVWRWLLALQQRRELPLVGRHRQQDDAFGTKIDN